jgi:branched-chain amino acid transport system permease protein
MKDPIAFLLLGLGAGGFYALLAAGVVVAFKGSGVINLAHGALASYCAFQYNYLIDDGKLRLPWFDFLPTHWLNVPVKIRVGPEDGLHWIPAFVLTMVTALLLGAMIHFLVFRPLRNAAPLGKVIGALGVMLYLPALMVVNFGTEANQPSSVLPDAVLKNFLGLGKPMPAESLALAGVAVAVGAAMWWLYGYTRFGLATRAAASNEKGAVLLGYSPERLALANWLIAASLAGLAGIIVGSVTGALNPVKFTSLVVFALGAALFGRLTSIPLAVAGGLALGLLDSFSTSWLRAQSWFPQFLAAGVKDALPLIVIGALLFVRGKSLPIRGTVEEKRLPLSPYPVRLKYHFPIWGVLATLASAGTIAVFAGLDGKWGFALTTSLISSMLCLSFVVITGYVGQISLAQLSIAGVAAFFASRMMANGSVDALNPFPVSGPDLPWWLAALMGIVVATVAGVILGLPALRIRGVQLAVVTIAAAVALQTLYFENEKLTGLRAGSNASVKVPYLGPWNIGAAGKNGLTDNPPFTVFCLVVLGLLVFAVANLRRSGTGRRFLAVRANERAAAAAGIDVPRTKLLASGVASAIAGVAGVMFAFQQVTVSSSNWTFFLGLGFLSFAFLAGITSINGALLGGLLAPAGVATVLGNHHFPGLGSYVPIIGGMSIILTAIIHPEGQAPFFQPLVQYFGRWLKNARAPEWTAAIKRVIPGIVPGAIFVAAMVWLKATEFRNWHVPLAIGFGLFTRGIGMQIYRGVKAAMAKARGVPGASAGHGMPAIAHAIAEEVGV